MLEVKWDEYRNEALFMIKLDIIKANMLTWKELEEWRNDILLELNTELDFAIRLWKGVKPNGIT